MAHQVSAIAENLDSSAGSKDDLIETLSPLMLQVLAPLRDTGVSLREDGSLERGRVALE